MNFLNTLAYFGSVTILAILSVALDLLYFDSDYRYLVIFCFCSPILVLWVHTSPNFGGVVIHVFFFCLAVVLIVKF